MPCLNLKVVENRLYSNVVDSSPRYARETIMPSLSTIETFIRFQVQEKHNASYFFKMSWTDQGLSNYKVNEKYLKQKAYIADF